MAFDYTRLRKDALYRAELIDWMEEDEPLRQEARLICKTNLLALCYVLGYSKIDPELHREALDFFLPRDLTKPVSRQGEGRMTKGTLLYPRGTYKTTIDEADIVQEVVCFPLDGITFVVSANFKLAEALVKNVAGHFIKPRGAHPTLFQSIFPELCVTDSRSGDGGVFTAGMRQVQPPIKEATVMAFSVESGVSGWHCWRFKGDDIANNRNMKSETSMAEVVRNYAINRKMLNPGGIEDKLGTRYGPLDPYGVELAKSRPGSYRFVVKPALRLKNGERLDANGFPPADEMELLFEKTGLTYEFLRDEYDADFSSFMTQYMNDSYGDNEVVFGQEEMLASLKDEAEMPLDGELYLRFRFPSKGLGWSFAAGVVGMMRGNRMHLIDGLHGAFKPSVLAAKILALAIKHDIHTITVDDSPGAVKLGPIITNHALTLGYSLNIAWAEFQPDAGERDLRIKSTESFFNDNRLVVSKEIPILRRLYEQYTGYGMMTEDAIPDIVSRLCERLPRSIANQAGSLEDGLALEMALQRDHWNMVHGGAGEYARRESETEAQDELGSQQHSPNPWGLDDIIPGLNA